MNASLIGSTYNRYKVIGDIVKVPSGKSTVKKVLCQCVCGSEPRLVSLSPLQTGRIKSCGCLQKDVASSKGDKTLIGKSFGELTVLSEAQPRYTSRGKIRRYFNCECSCGSGVKEYRIDVIKSGSSCGCLQKKAASKLNKTHGMSKTPIYFVWQAMKDRCLNPANPQYHDYGGRGITVCKEWETSFENFYQDMSCGYTDGFDLDKIDNDKGYSKSNCRWVERDYGNHNKRKPKGCSSVYKGVYFDKRKNTYIARLNKGGIQVFETSGSEIECAKAYDDASELHYGDRPNKTVRN